MALNTNEQPCCNDPVPCTECSESLYDRTCSTILSTSCVVYNAIGNGPSLVQCLGIENGVTLTTVLEALCDKISATTAVYDINSFNLGCLRGEYKITDLKSVVEAITNKLCKNTNDIITLTNYYNQLGNSIDNVINFINNPNLSFLYNIGIEEGDSLADIITKIVNILGTILENGVGSDSPRIKTINTNSIAFATGGTLDHTITANVVVAPNADNLLRITANGLYVGPTRQILTYDPTTGKVCLSNNGGCFILPPERDFNETNLVANNSKTVTFVQSGVKGHTITAHVNIDALLTEIYNNPVWKSKFCNICATTNCAGQSTTPVWTDTTEVRCSGNNLEKKQTDTNPCSSTFQLAQWVLKQANASVCTTLEPDYCIALNCDVSNCLTTSSQDCQSVQVCLRDKNTGKLVSAPEDIVINYTAAINGSPQQYTFTLAQGLVSAEGQCHCANVDLPGYNIGNVTYTGQTNNNKGKGYALCTTTPVNPTPITPTPVLTYTTPTIVLNCTNKTLSTTGTFGNSTSLTINLLKESVLVQTKSNQTGPNYSASFTVNENGFYQIQVSDSSNPAKVSNVFNYTCVTPTPITPTPITPTPITPTPITPTPITPTPITPITPTPITPTPTPVTPSALAQHSCSNHTIQVTGTLPGATRIGIHLLLGEDIVQLVQELSNPGPNFDYTFPNVNGNGTYKARVYEVNNDGNKVISPAIIVTCENVPAEQPQGCVRPSNLTDYKFVWHASPTGQSGYQFSSHEQACQSYKNITSGKTSGTLEQFTAEFNGPTVGNIAYVVDNTTNCSYLSPGYYYILNNDNSDAGYTLQIGANGAVVDYFQCNYVPTPDVCTRPTGLTHFQLIWNAYAGQDPSTTTTFNSTADACNKVNTGVFRDGTYQTSSNFDIQTAADLVTGSTVYVGVTTDCNKVGAGFYYVVDSSGQNTVVKAIGVDANGVITESVTCVTSTPVPTDGEINPSDVGSAALNVVMLDKANTKLVVKTPGLSITGSELVATNDVNKCFLKGNSVATALANASYGYAPPVNGSIGYYAFAFNIVKLRQAFPSLTELVFDVVVDSKVSENLVVNRVNYSYHASKGIESTCPQDTTPCRPYYYEYIEKTTSKGGNLIYENYMSKFTLVNGEEKTIGTMRINLVSGVSQFVIS